MTLDPGDFEPEDRPVTLHRVRPADVTLPDGTRLDKALAIVTERRVYVWTAERGAVVLRYLAEHTGVTTSSLPSAPIRVQVGGDGDVLIAKGSGCGCGSPLAGHVPWTPQRSGT